MPWREYKKGLLLKLVDILQSMATWLTPEVHAPGLQENNPRQAEDDRLAQWLERYEASRSPENWPKLITKHSGDDGTKPIDGRDERDRPLITARQTTGEVPERTIVGRKTEPTPAADESGPMRSSQQTEPKPAGLKTAGLKTAGLKPKSPAQSVAKSALPHYSRVQPEMEARPPLERISEVGVEPREPQISVAASDARAQNSGNSAGEPRSSRKDPWYSRAARKIATRFRLASQSSAVRQPRSRAAKSASSNHAESLVIAEPSVLAEPPVIFSEANVFKKEEEFQPLHPAIHAGEHHRPLSIDNGTKNRKPASEGTARLAGQRLQLPDHAEQNKFAAKHDSDNGLGTTANAALRRQRETAAPVVPWPNSPVRVTTTETEHWTNPFPAIPGNNERNLTTAAASSWKRSPDQENAPGLPLLPLEFRSSAESSGGSGAIYPWPELPQVVEEDPEEPRRLLQNHERQIRILREQRGAW